MMENNEIKCQRKTGKSKTVIATRFSPFNKFLIIDSDIIVSN